jgi:hypothetical protein
VDVDMMDMALNYSTMADKVTIVNLTVKTSMNLIVTLRNLWRRGVFSQQNEVST